MRNSKIACTGLSATWCPIHGDCICERSSVDGGFTSFDHLNNAACPLHSSLPTPFNTEHPRKRKKSLTMRRTLFKRKRCLHVDVKGVYGDSISVQDQ